MDQFDFLQADKHWSKRRTDVLLGMGTHNQICAKFPEESLIFLMCLMGSTLG